MQNASRLFAFVLSHVSQQVFTLVFFNCNGGRFRSRYAPLRARDAISLNMRPVTMSVVSKKGHETIVGLTSLHDLAQSCESAVSGNRSWKVSPPPTL